MRQRNHRAIQTTPTWLGSVALQSADPAHRSSMPTLELHTIATALITSWERLAGAMFFLVLLLVGPAASADCSDVTQAHQNTFEVKGQEPLLIDVAARDSSFPLKVESVNNIDCAGTVRLNPEGTITFTSVGSFSGSCSLTYEAEDPQGKVTTASLSLVGTSLTPLLSKHPDNPRFLCDSLGNTVYLSGAHVWQNIQAYGNPPPANACNNASGDQEEDHSCGQEEWDYLRARGHNFTRGWHWEQPAGFVGQSGWTVEPAVPFRTEEGIGLGAEDPKYNLKEYDPIYFDRLRERVAAAKAAGLYISVMLFEGHSVRGVDGSGDTIWGSHPFNPVNNNTHPDLVVDLDNDGDGEEIHTLLFNDDDNDCDVTDDDSDCDVTDLQKAYIERVVAELNAFDNIIWEICNECGDRNGSVPQMRFIEWMDEMAKHIKLLEGTPEYPVEHLVWVSPLRGNHANSLLSGIQHADVISLRGSEYQFMLPAYDPMTMNGKTVLLDSDHIGNPTCLVSQRYNASTPWCDTGWPWKAFTGGFHPVFMDTVRSLFPADLGSADDANGDGVVDDPQRLVKKERFVLGQTAHYANEVIQDLAAMEPRGAELSTTGYSLANPGFEYLVFQPDAGNFSVNLLANQYRFEWFDTEANGGEGEVVDFGWITVEGSGWREFSPPQASDVRWVLHLVQGAPPSCQPDFDTLCFAEGRFAVTATWFNPYNQTTGPAHASPHPSVDATGYFWFGEPENLEIGFKMLEVGDNFWLYHGALTTFNYTITVNDLHRTEEKIYQKVGDDLCGGSDTGSFPAFLSNGQTSARAERFEEWVGSTTFQAAIKASSTQGGTCIPGPLNFCLMNNRFSIQVMRPGSPNGVAQPVESLSDQAGDAYFFSPENREVAVKMIDRVADAGKYWIFIGSMTDQEYSVVVTDTVSGIVREYHPEEPFCGLYDLDLCDVCPVTSTFNATADAWTNELAQTQNYGTDTSLRVRAASTQKGNHAYLKFTVTGITGPVQAATLRIKTQSTAFPSARIYHIATTNWIENEIDWQNGPIDLLGTWVLGALDADTWIEIDVSSIINGNGTYTIGLVAADEPDLAYWSRESADPPTLQVTYQP